VCFGQSSKNPIFLNINGAESDFLKKTVSFDRIQNSTGRFFPPADFNPGFGPPTSDRRSPVDKHMVTHTPLSSLSHH
jgi:hypothetical protein